jgi:hypothetical protein
MKAEDRIKAFSELGKIISETISGAGTKYSALLNDLIMRQEKVNGWLTPSFVKLALKAIAEELNYDNLKTWTGKYPAINIDHKPLTTGVVMAGNIPLAGFHDFLCVLISGNKIKARTSSKDPDLIKAIGKILCRINPTFNDLIEFTEEPLSGFDLIIATGSDNSSRYFEYYFGKYPHIIRRNRNSVAIIDGTESKSDIQNLGNDIFSYFGLGCRNVSKIFIPEGYNITKMVKNWEGFSYVANNNKYANNYDYNKAIWMVNREKFLDTGFVLLKESKELSSPVSVLYYEHYDNDIKLDKILKEHSEKIQCIVGKKYIPFGRAQFPKLWDYADNTDTLDFLLKKNSAGIL